MDAAAVFKKEDRLIYGSLCTALVWEYPYSL